MENQKSTSKSTLTLSHSLKRVNDSASIDAALGTHINNTLPHQHHTLDIDNHHNDIQQPSKNLPFVLSFSNLTYNVKNIRRPKLISSSSRPTTSTATKTILDNISGSARDGEITAILGASGSGKSTLIDALANRIAKGSLKGTITLNGQSDIDSRFMKAISSYVMQDDLLFPMLTVEETFMFAAEFRLPRTLFSVSNKRERVAKLIDQLGLKDAANTVIGDEGHRGISGGERRRVSIGIDIIHDPMLLFLDEPTSGLDSTSAFMVVKVLRKVAQSGSVVVMSIHQPSYRILGLLDNLIFLSKGQTVYNGAPRKLQGFLAEFGHPVPENENTAEFALDLVRQLEEEEYSPDQYGTKSLVEFNVKWQKKTILKNSTHTIQLESESAPATAAKNNMINIKPTTILTPSFANPFWIEMWVLTKRTLINSRRKPEQFLVRLAAVLITAFILSTVYWRLDDSPAGAQERLSFFALAMSMTFYSSIEALPVFLQHKYIFLRETSHNAYRRSSYVLSTSLSSLPTLLLLSLAFTASTFWAVGLSGGLIHGFLFYFLITFASFWTGNSFVSFLSTVVPNVMIGNIVAVAVLAYYLLFSGFFIDRDRIPTYWIWFHYISLMKYPYEAVLRNEFQDPTSSKCFMTGIQIFDGTRFEAAPYETKVKFLGTMNSSLGVTVTPSTCVTNGMDVLARLGVDDLSKWNCLWITVAWGFLFRILFYFSLLFGSRNKRR